MTIRTDGIVIREQITGERDRLVTLLTRENGIIKAFVNGAKSPKSKNAAATGLLCYSDFLIEKNSKNIYVVKEAAAKEVFFSLREDIVALSLAQYFAELTYELASREEKSEEFLSLILNAVYLVTKGKKNNALIKSVAELRMLCIAGYMPSVVACVNCGQYESQNMYFDLFTGELFCEQCNLKNSLQQLPLSVVSAIRFICFSDANKIFSFNLPEEEMETLSWITERYLRNITGKKFRTLDFYKMMT